MPTTVLEVVKDLNQRFALHRVVFVGDRGMMTMGNVEQLRHSQQGYLLGLQRRNRKDAFDYIQEAAARTEGPTGKFLIGMMAEVAELEAGMISQRTKAALAAAKARGKKLGGRRVSAERWQEIGEGAVVVARQAQMERAAERRDLVLPVIRQLRASGATSLRAIAAGLKDRGIEAPRGGDWSAVQVKRILDKAAETEAA
jgi:DNA invertase Pin-like site-specific DNA recombinase